MSAAAVNLIVVIPRGVTCSCGHSLVRKSLEINTKGLRYMVIRTDGIYVKCPKCKSLRPLHEKGPRFP